MYNKVKASTGTMQYAQKIISENLCMCFMSYKQYPMHRCCCWAKAEVVYFVCTPAYSYKYSTSLDERPYMKEGNLCYKTTFGLLKKGYCIANYFTKCYFIDGLSAGISYSCIKNLVLQLIKL